MTGSGGDQVNVQTTGAPTFLFGTGATTVNVGTAGSVQGIAGKLTIESLSGSNTVTVDDSADGIPRMTTLLSLFPPFVDSTFGIIKGLAPAPIWYEYADTNSVTINTGNAAGNVVNVLATGVPTNLVGNASTIVYIGKAGSVQGIRGVLNLENPPNYDDITVDDSLDPAVRLVNLSTLGVNATDSEGNTDPWGRIRGLAPADINYEYLDTRGLTIKTGTAAGTAVYVSDTGVTTNLVGNAATAVHIGNAGSVQGIRGVLNLENPPSHDGVTVDDSLDPTARTVSLSTLDVTADSQDNTDPWGRIHGLAPADINYEYADTFNLTIVTGPAAGTVVNVQATGTITDLIGNAAATVNIGSLTPALGGTLTNILGKVTVFNDGGATALILDDSGNAARQTYLLTDTGMGPISWLPSQLSGLTILGGSAGNTFLLQTTGSGPLTTVDAGPGDDTFVFNDQAVVHGVLDGQGGYDTLDYRAYTTPTAVNLATGTATGVTGGVRDIENVIGATMTLTVTNTADSGPGSLRQAILDANNHAGLDIIDFAIPGTGVQTISPGSPLPDITDKVIIDGYSQPGASANTLAVGDNAVLLIQLDGSNAGLGANGLHITAGNSTVQGLMIDNFARTPAPSYLGGNGVLGDTNGGNVIQGNFLGTHSPGYPNFSNGNYDVLVDLGSSNNLIGGTTPAARNILSGAGSGMGLFRGATNNRVQGNYVGTDPTGTHAVPNFDGIADGGQGTTIGGTTPGAGNVISGNVRIGVYGGVGGATQGNLIGTDASGTHLLSNGSFGIFGPNGELIGGTAPGARNVITGAGGICIFLLYVPGNVVQGNFIGTDISGSAPLGDPTDGIAIQGSNNNVIGGVGPGSGNVIANCYQDNVYLLLGSTGNVVQGNHIGTNAAGGAALGLNGDGVLINLGSANNTIGGTAPGAGNLISGNTNGVEIDDAGSTGNVVLGNRIGTDVTGTVALGNFIGVYIANGAAGNTIGGTTAAARNVISGNVDGVFDAVGATTASQGNLIQGNYVGLNAAGAAALPNTEDGVDPGNYDTVGGTAPGAGNVISGNGRFGVGFNGDYITVQGNRIGTDATGTYALGNNWGIIASNSLGNLIGGPTIAARNVISGNNTGIEIGGSFAHDNVVQGNYIGTNAAGSAAVGNNYDGLFIAFSSNNTVAGNVISGNGLHGIEIASSPGFDAANNVVQGNFVGTDATGAFALGNAQDGILIHAGAHDNPIGAPMTATGDPTGFGNTIAFNGGAGVAARDATTIDNTIRGNSIFGNTGKGIDLATSGVTLNPPTLLTASANATTTFLTGSFSLPAAGSYVLDFYSSPVGGPAPAKRYLGSMTVSAGGSFTGTLPVGTGGEMLTATATDAAGNTSEFAASIYVLPPARLVVFANGAVTYTAGAGAVNNLTISQNAGVYTFTDAGELIVATTIGAFQCTGSGTNKVTCSATGSTPIASINVDTGDLQDIVNVRSTGVPTTITKSSGDATVNLGEPAILSPGTWVLLDITGSVTVHNPHGHTVLNVKNDGDSFGGHQVTIDQGAITRLAPAGIYYDQSALAGLNITGGSGGNTFTLNNTPDNSLHPMTTLTTGSGPDSVTVAATQGPLTIAGSFAATIALGQGSVANIVGPVTITNSAASLAVDDSQDPTSRNVTLSATQLIGLVPTIIYPASGSGSLDVHAGKGGNTITVTGTPALTGANQTTLETGIGGDTVNVQRTAGQLAINAGIYTATVNVTDAGSVQEIQGQVTITGGLVKVTLDDRHDATPQFVSINGGLISGLAPAIIQVPGVSLFSLEIDGGSGGNSWFVDATPKFMSMTLNTGSGADTVQVRGNSCPLFINGQGGKDSVSIARVNVGMSGTPSDFATLNPVTVGNIASDGSPGATTLLVDYADHFLGQPGILTLHSDSVALEQDSMTGQPVEGVYWSPTNSGIASLSVLAPDNVLASFQTHVYVQNSPPFPTEIHQGIAYTSAFVQATTGALTVEADATTLGNLGQQSDTSTLANLNGPVHVVELTATGTVQSAGPQTVAGNLELSPFDGSYYGKILQFTSGPQAGQQFPITAYKGRSRTFTLDGVLYPAPLAGDTFRIFIDAGPHQNMGGRSLVLDDYNDPLPRMASVAANSVTGLAPHAAITYQTDIFPLPVSVLGGGGSDTFIVTGVPMAGSLTIDGGGGSNTLQGPDVQSTWNITSPDAGNSSAGFTFSSIQSLVGGSTNDSFVFMNGGSLAGTVDGGGGTNTLDYSHYAGDVTVDLALNQASLVHLGLTDSVFHIANVIGSNGNNLIVGDANPNVLRGGTGRNIIIGGPGADTIYGGGGDNILIGGYTSWDQNLVALDAIFAEWTSTASLSVRRNHLRFGGGLNGSYGLTGVSTAQATQSVFDDGAIDLLYDGMGTAWFFVHKPDDTINDGSGPLANDFVSIIK
jgi:parallel beta-helix repeat protein